MSFQSATEKIRAAKAAAGSLANATTAQRNRALQEITVLLAKYASEIVGANQDDLQRAQQEGMSPGLQDRLRLDQSRIHELIDAVRLIIDLPDPVGQVVQGKTLPNGLKLTQIRVPFGVIGAIYEARPNVTIDIAALAIKSGNAVVLRGGSAAERTNAELVTVIQDALALAGLDSAAVQTIDDFGRDGAVELMEATGLVDVLIPRGGAGLIHAVVENSKVPVIQTGDGVVHLFVDESANLEMAVNLVHNSKVQRPSVCNALETLLVHQATAPRVLPAILAKLEQAGVTIHGDATVQQLYPKAVAATEDDWRAEYYSLDLAVRVVTDLDAALEHIKTYSTKHTEAIVTEQLANAERFLDEVDAAVVMVNAATRFTDGGQFGFGAEVGISTQKLHARGPMGLNELTSTKWLVRGSGQIRA